MNINGSSLIGLKENGVFADKSKEAKLQKACKDFEAIILKQMLTTMRKSIPKGGLFNKEFADDIYQSMHDEELAKNMAKGKGIGIGDLLYQQLNGTIKTTTSK